MLSFTFTLQQDFLAKNKELVIYAGGKLGTNFGKKKSYVLFASCQRPSGHHVSPADLLLNPVTYSLLSSK